MVKIVGKAQQRRYADAFVLRDLEREGELPYKTVKQIIFSPANTFPPGFRAQGRVRVEVRVRVRFRVRI